MHARLIAVWLLLLAAACATGFLLYEFYAQSSAVQLDKTEVAAERACHEIADRYAFSVASSNGQAGDAMDVAFRRRLVATVSAALSKAQGVEGGIWSGEAGSIAYAFPTYEGTGPKTDVPAAEIDKIREINAEALDSTEMRRAISPGRSQTLVLLACPLRGPIPRLTAWTMARALTGRGPAYTQFLFGLTVLTFTVVASAIFLGRVIVSHSRRIKTIEGALTTHEDLSGLPHIAPTGERELDRIVSALNAASARLADARARLLAAERLAAIGAVAAGVAHEIRNPMAAIRLKAENALASEDPLRAAKALRVAIEQMDRMNDLLGDLLSLAHFRAPLREPTDVAAVIREAADLHAEAAADGGVSVSIRCELESDARVQLDGKQLFRAVGNLLLNAIEAAGGQSGGAVVVEARRVARNDGDCFSIVVSDNGPGVPEKMRGRLFEPFETTKAAGHGLGLAIVREIAEAHGGVVRLAPSKVGARFEMELPWRES